MESEKLKKKREYSKKMREEYLRLKENPEAEPSINYHGRKYSSIVEAYEAKLKCIKKNNNIRQAKLHEAARNRALNILIENRNKILNALKFIYKDFDSQES